MNVLTRPRSRIYRIIQRDEENEGAHQGSRDMNNKVPYSLELKHKDLIKEKEKKRCRDHDTDRGIREEENKSMVSCARARAINDLFRESPLRSLGPRYTFIYRRYL